MATSSVGESIHEILPGIFIGNSDAVLSAETLNEKNITHVLSLGDFGDLPLKVAHKHINVYDVPEENIIQHFDDTFEFINEAHKSNGNILIHCEAGMSRSPTILAAYIMRSQQISAAKAIEMITEKRASILPNSGFRDQLNLYERLKYDVNAKHAEYRRFLMASAAEEQRAHGYIENMTLAPDPEMLKATNQTVKQLRCRKCRRVLADMDNVIEHQPGKGQQAFSYFKRNTEIDITASSTSNPLSENARTPINQALNPLLASIAASNNNCSSYFVEPMEWMADIHGYQIQGRLDCPKCTAKLGSFNWSGEQCSCGRWITPAFMLHRKNVDEIKAVTRR
ncbi:protein-tyrosine phosphatase-like protein [Radiomyces spectabilis]|uniref:protein-tyrosine phosphatase-like protein n=1 Tax=Radiomyces spectabilis TaxID=64574 RepID=UPI00222112D5|nr:protein-tyrosine phosphatase-like protein [Radiomyces spectabilis]KAI8373119.1 protein-tyrosine phosphatase-like protein [Radiomyces spectabilis]